MANIGLWWLTLDCNIGLQHWTAMANIWIIPRRTLPKSVIYFWCCCGHSGRLVQTCIKWQARQRVLWPFTLSRSACGASALICHYVHTRSLCIVATNLRWIVNILPVLSSYSLPGDFRRRILQIYIDYFYTVFTGLIDPDTKEHVTCCW